MQHMVAQGRSMSGSAIAGSGSGSSSSSHGTFRLRSVLQQQWPYVH